MRRPTLTATTKRHIDAELTNSLAGVLTVVAVGYSGLAVANSMALAAVGRRGDLAVLRSAGGTRRQLLGVAVGETGLLVIIGSVLGLLATVLPLAGVASGLGAETATRVSVQLGGAAAAGAVLGTLALATAASAFVSWRQLRARST